MAPRPPRTPSSPHAQRQASSPQIPAWLVEKLGDNIRPGDDPSNQVRPANYGHHDHDDRGGKRIQTSIAAPTSIPNSPSSSWENMKRTAAEYITKEHGTLQNPEQAEEKVKMATAAQRAQRKVLTPKSRTGRSTTPTAPSTFAQSSTAHFGSNTAQSFPPPTQSQSFNFQVPSSAQSFTFGQQNGAAQSFSNPFASMNGQSNTTDNAMMDTSPQKNNTNTLFSFGQSAAQPPSQPALNGFTPAQPTPQQPSSAGFGGGNLFGQKPDQQKEAPKLAGSGSNLFGSQAQTSGFSFGQQSAAPSSTPLFGQSSTTSAPAFGGFGSASSTAVGNAPAPAPAFKFGQTSVVDTKSVSPQPDEPTTPKSATGFSFGQTAPFGQPSADAALGSAPAKSSFAFGEPAGNSTVSRPDQTPSKPLFSFGPPASTSQPQPASAPPSKSLFSFPSPNTDAAPSNGNLFGKVSTTAAPSPSLDPVFGRAPSADEASQSPSANEEQQSPAEGQGREEPQKPTNPFASLFNAQKGGTETAISTTKAPFQFAQTSSFTSPAKAAEPSSTSSNVFEAKASDGPAQQDQPDSRKTSLFDFSRPNASTSGTFSPQSSTSNNTFNSGAAAVAESTTPQKAPSTKSLFGQQSSDVNDNAGSTPFKFGQSSHQVTSEDAPPAKKRLFQSSTAQESMQTSAGLSSQPAPITPKEPVQPKFTQPQQPSVHQEAITRAVSTEGPPQIPRFLSADKYKSYDENWRLKALNRRFKAHVADVNPDTHDFMSVVQNYLDHREAIGEGLGQYFRKQTAGTKRKAIDVDDMQDDGDQNKKSRAAGTSSSTHPFGSKPTQPVPATTSSNIFGSVPSPKPSTSVSPPKPASSTSNLFKSMIPGASNSPSAVFGASGSKSTTPPSSPPKPAAVQMPKFELPKFGGGDFAGAFAKNAAEMAQKFSETDKEKRKAEDFDSDEDDEEAWEKKYEEEQRAKRAKIEAAAKANLAVPGFIPSASTSRSNSPFPFSQPAQSIEKPETDNSEQAAISIETDGEEQTSSGANESSQSGNDSGNSGDDEDDLPEDQGENGQDEDEDEAEPIPDLPKGQSLFDRISKPNSPKKTAGDNAILESPKKGYYKPSVMFGHIGKDSPSQPAVSPFTPPNGVKPDFVPASTFNFTSTPATGPLFGSSLKIDGPIPGEGLFGSRPSTPQPGSQEKTATSAIQSDQTWKKGSPIKFGVSTSDSDSAAPAIEVHGATPPAKESKRPNFFGAASSQGSLGFSFGAPPTANPAPGFLGAASYLNPDTPSGLSSRGSSPGIPSEAETDVSNAEDRENANEPQTDLMASNAGEEDEDILFTAKASIHRLYRKNELPEKSKLKEGWNKMGTGSARVLKHKETEKSRIIFRSEPSSNVVLNSRLIPGAKYASLKAGSMGAVSFPVAVDGGMQLWMIKVKTKESADEMAGIMELNKSN